MSDSLRPHESQWARPPCSSPSPGVHSDWRPSSQWCHPAISSSVVPFSSCPQSLPASEFSGLLNSNSRIISQPFKLYFSCLKTERWGPLVAQWWGVHLPMQGTLVRSLVWEEPTHCRETRPRHHNYWDCALEPTHYWALLTLLKPAFPRVHSQKKGSPCNEKPVQPI